MFTQLFVFGVLTVTAINSAVVPNPKIEEYCWTTDPIREQVKHFSTRTAYQNVRGDLTQWANVPGKFNNNYNRKSKRLISLLKIC